MSQFRNCLMASSGSIANKVIYDLSSNQITLGSAFMVYDKLMEKYGAVLTSSLEWETFDSERFETNYDVPVARFETARGTYLHAVAMDEAINPNRYPGIQQYNYIDTNYSAAEYCFYRIEVDNSKAGGFHFKVTSGNGTSEGDVSWSANDSVASIRAQMGTPSLSGVFIKYDVTTNNPVINGNSVRSLSGEAIGVAVGGYGANTCVLSAIVDNSAEVIDMSKYAVISNIIKVNDPYNSSLAVINANFKNWRGQSCQTILGSSLIPVGPDSMIIGNSGYAYGYRSGVNFAGFKDWATNSGNASYITDGVNGTTNNSNNAIMRKSYFDDMMNSSNANYNVQMATYYNNLLNSTDEPYNTLRHTYSTWYNYTPQELYDVYVMTHMIKINASSGSVYSVMNRGKELSDVKGRTFTVTYNYTYVPAYGPEYNSLHYGVTGSEGFAPGHYYHPETGDLGVFLRDDMLAACNSSWNMAPQQEQTRKTELRNDVHLGSVGEFDSRSSWNFYGATRALDFSGRRDSFFRSRPCSAYIIS